MSNPTSNPQFTREQLEFIRTEIYASLSCGATDPLFQATYDRVVGMLRSSRETDTQSTSNKSIAPPALWQWLIDMANQAGPFDSRMLMAAADIVGAAKMSGVCWWTRLPDITDPSEANPVQYKARCDGQTTRSAHAVYPDNCPRCHARIKIKTGS